jgi:hypothetical protein
LLPADLTDLLLLQLSRSDGEAALLLLFAIRAARDLNASLAMISEALVGEVEVRMDELNVEFMFVLEL